MRHRTYFNVLVCVSLYYFYGCKSSFRCFCHTVLLLSPYCVCAWQINHSFIQLKCSGVFIYTKLMAFGNTLGMEPVR